MLLPRINSFSVSPVLLLVLGFGVLIFRISIAQQPLAQQNISPGQNAATLFTGVGTNPAFGGLWTFLLEIRISVLVLNPPLFFCQLEIFLFESIGVDYFFFRNGSLFSILVNLVPFGPDVGDHMVHPGMLTAGQTIDLHMFFPFYGGLYNYSTVFVKKCFDFSFLWICSVFFSLFFVFGFRGRVLCY